MVKSVSETPVIENDGLTTSASSQTNLDSLPHVNHNGPSIAWWHPIVAGGIAGVSGGYINYLFEGMKKRKQREEAQPFQKALELMKTGEHSAFHVTRNTLKEYFRGANAFALTLGPVSMVQVTIDNYSKKVLPENTPSWVYNMVGISSGAAGALVSSPVEHIILTQQQLKIGPIDAIKHLMARGYTYPWTALSPLMFREAGFGFSMLVGAKKTGQVLSQVSGMDLQLVGEIGCGLVAAAATQPFDLLATKKQMSPQPISLMTAVKQTYQTEGVMAFFKGYSHRAFLFTGCVIVIGNLEKLIQKKLADKSFSKLGFFSRNNDSNQKPVVEASEEQAPRPKK